MYYKFRNKCQVLVLFAKFVKDVRRLFDDRGEFQELLARRLARSQTERVQVLDRTGVGCTL